MTDRYASRTGLAISAGIKSAVEMPVAVVSEVISETTAPETVFKILPIVDDIDNMGGWQARRWQTK